MLVCSPCCLAPVFMCNCFFMPSFQHMKTSCHCTHPLTRLQCSTVEGQQKDMWGDSPPFFRTEKDPNCVWAPSSPSPRMPLEVQRKKRKKFREREREGGKAGSLCSCSCRGLWITSEWQRRKEREQREEKGHPKERGHQQEGVRHTPQIRPLFFGHALFSCSFTPCISIKGCSGAALHRAIIVIQARSMHTYTHTHTHTGIHTHITK